MKGKTVILNIAFGKNPYCRKRHFLPIAAGASRKDILTDAEGEDNISNKNKSYGDFTALYWAWKHLKDVNIFGISHYRRYIADADYLKPGTYVMRWWQFRMSRYSVKQFENDLRKYDFIMTQSYRMDCSVYEHYVKNHPYPKNIEITTEALRKIHPDCVDIWENYLAGNEWINGYIFVTHWTYFCQLMEWLYPVLEEIEKHIDVDDFNGYQSRVIGYLYERLVPVFLKRYNFSIKEYGLYYIETEKYHSPLYLKWKNSKWWKYLREKYYCFLKKV